MWTFVQHTIMDLRSPYLLNGKRYEEADEIFGFGARLRGLSKNMFSRIFF